MYAWPKFHGSSPYSLSENDLNTKKFTPPPPTTTTPEKQYICLASASQARQKPTNSAVFSQYIGTLTSFCSYDKVWTNWPIADRPVFDHPAPMAYTYPSQLLGHLGIINSNG